MSEKVKIAIVGASFAGLRAYISLKKRFPKAIFYLFDKEDYFTFIPSLHLSLCRPSHLQKSQFSLKRYFGEAFIHEEVISIKDHLIETKKKTYAFDYAVISTGAKVNYFGNDDLKKHALGAKSVPHLKVLHKRLPAAKKIVIIGGGLSGVEYAAMLGATSDKEVTLINGADRLLPAILPKAGAYANRYLEKKGVKVIHDAKAVSATEKKVVLDSGEEIPADMIMMCTGLKQFCPLLDSSPITDTLHLEDDDHIFLCGDVAKSDKVPTAHAAMIEGDIVAEHICAKLHQREPKPRLMKRQTTLAVGLGPQAGFIVFRSWYLPLPFTGFLKLHIEKSILLSFKRRIKLFI